jgi:hypothetical protein
MTFPQIFYVKADDMAGLVAFAARAVGDAITSPTQPEGEAVCRVTIELVTE